MARRKKLYDGKRKILYGGSEPGTLIQHFKDEAPMDENAPPTDGHGILNNRLSEFFMSRLDAIGVPTHFIRRLNMREQLVRMAEIVPLKIVVRNFANGAFSERMGIPPGTPLPRPIVEYYYNDEQLSAPMVGEEHIVAFGWATHQDLDEIISMALRVNDFMSGAMAAIGVRLADFQLEIGRIWEGDYMRLILTNEISPDKCSLWDMRGVTDRVDGQPIADPGPLIDPHNELARRFGVMPSHITHRLVAKMVN